MTSPIWTIESHTPADKSFQINPPTAVSMEFEYSGFTLTVDYDDVNHKAVDKLVQKIVTILNANLDKL